MLPMVKCGADGWWPPGCGIVSQANDDFASSVTAYIAGILENMASWMWSFISGAFGVSNIDASVWTIVSGLTNWWIVVMMTPLVVVMIVQLIAGLVSQQPRRIGRALIGGALAVPLVFVATSLMGKLSSFTDSASTALLQTLGTDPYVVFMRLFGFQRAPAGSGRAWDVISMSVGSAAGPVGGVVVTAIAVLVVWILSFILMCSMIFRSFALIVLSAVAPVALMLLPWERTKSWTRIWCETVVALLIAKPLAATVLAVAVKLFANSTSFSGLASGAVGMVLACGAPLMALKLVSFAGGEIAGAAQMAGGGHVVSRAGSFTGRQLGRQFGGKTHLPGTGDKGPSPVPSTPRVGSLHQNSVPLGTPAPFGRSGPQGSPSRPSGGAWPMPGPAPAGDAASGHGNKGPETPARDQANVSTPQTAGASRGPTTSRYPGRRSTTAASPPPPSPAPAPTMKPPDVQGRQTTAPPNIPPRTAPAHDPRNGDGNHV
jgi:hypothetical protein